ncbi:MAG: methionine--tRNA ligase, partial [Actinomycetota bacterium]
PPREAEERPAGAAADEPRHAGAVQPGGDGEERGEDPRGEPYTVRVSDETFYLTTPIYYVNAEPHVGHAYTTIMADILARHHRQRGEDVFFLTGTDEHGAKIARSADELGRSPREHADALSARFREMAGTLEASNDFFIRTTDDGHRAAVQELLQRMHARGDIYRGSYGGWYCTSCEAFYAEGDLDADRRCPTHGRPAEWLEEDNWFFRLSAYRDRLLAHLDANPGFVVPQVRYNEARRMIEDGLDDISLSRSQVAWGIPVPWDPDQVVYVWIDALFNYLTALTYARPGEDLVARYWPPDVQLMAKDILKFHAVIWPSLLMSAGVELPRRLAIHGFVLKGGERLSKTTGNVVDPFPYVERYGIDALRYYLAREVRFGEDGTFSDETFEERYTRDLGNDLGNLVNRTVAMIDRYRGGEVPADPGGDGDLAGYVAERVAAVRDAFDAVDITRGVNEAWELVRRLNQLVEERKPWELAKSPDTARDLDQALASLAEGLRVALILLWPYIPGKAEDGLARLGQPADASLARAPWGAGAAGARVVKGEPLFPRVEREEAAA